MSLKNCLLICGLLLTAAVYLGSTESKLLKALKPANTRIIGGQLAHPGQFPFIVSLIGLNGTKVWHRCGGTLISDRWILSAAHCSFGEFFQDPANTRIQVGATNRITDGEVYTVDLIVNHPEYNTSTLDNDVSLLRLSEPLEWSESVQPMPLKRTFIDAGVRVLTLGWGLTDATATESPDNLKFLHLYTLENDDCRERLPANRRELVANGTLCTSLGVGFDVCNGDSGGPLVVRNHLIGVTSWTNKPCGRGGPNGYARVSTYLDWITEVSNVTAPNFE